MLVQIGNNWIQKIPLTAGQIGLGLRPRPILAVLGIFSSNYFQIEQHVVLLHNITVHLEFPTLLKTKNPHSIKFHGKMFLDDLIYR